MSTRCPLGEHGRGCAWGFRQILSELAEQQHSDKYPALLSQTLLGVVQQLVLFRRYG